MKSGSSALISSGGQSSDTLAASSWYQKSRPACMAHEPPVRRMTITFSSPSDLVSASSVLCLSLTVLPPRTPSSAVMTSFDLQSVMRPTSESGEKPPNTTEWMAPMRAQASMA